MKVFFLKTVCQGGRRMLHDVVCGGCCVGEQTAVSPAVRGLAELRGLLVCAGVTIFCKNANTQPVSRQRTDTATRYVPQPAPPPRFQSDISLCIFSRKIRLFCFLFFCFFTQNLCSRCGKDDTSKGENANG